MKNRIVPFLLTLLALSLMTPPSVADTLDDIRARGVIRWAGDEEGGAPYIVPTQNKTKPDGFEGELMVELAKKIGVQPEFKQCAWVTLTDLLRAEGADIIVNGVELRVDRMRQFLSTIPYYANDLQLVGRKDDSRLRSWADLYRKPANGTWRIGVLQDTAAERYLIQNYPREVTIAPYDGTTQPLDHVRDKLLDATLTDVMAATTYLGRYPTLQAVGEPVGRNYFVIYVRLGDERLRDELNAAIREMIADGRLRRIYEKYHIWNAAQETLSHPEVQTEPDRMFAGDNPPSRGEMLRGSFGRLLGAAFTTIALSLVSMPLAILVGLLVAIGRLYGPLALRGILLVYVEVIRGTPLAMQLFLIYYVLPSVVPIPDWLKGEYFAYICAVVGLAVNYSAYEAEIYRAGLLAIPPGQMEAALALGMSRRQALFHVLVPQAARIVIPPVTSDFIALFKDTAVCQIITIVELSKQYAIYSNNTGLVLEFAAITAALYLVMSLPLVILSRRLERGRPRINV